MLLRFSFRMLLNFPLRRPCFFGYFCVEIQTYGALMAFTKYQTYPYLCNFVIIFIKFSLYLESEFNPIFKQYIDVS